MASKRENRPFRISAVPWRPGLVTAGQRTSIPELDLWKARNTSADLDGLLRMRPGLDQWGQTLKAPDVDATGATLQAFADFLADTAGFVDTDASTGLVANTVVTGELRTTVSAGSGNKNRVLSYAVTLSANTAWSLRVLVRGTNLPDYGVGTTANTLAIRAQGASGSGKEFAIWSGGLYYKRASDDTYVLVTGSEFVGTGGWHAVEIHCDSTGNTLVYVDDILLTTIVSTTLATASFTNANSAFEFDWEVEGSGSSGTQYSTAIATPMYNDADEDPFEAVDVVAMSDFQYLTTSSAKVRSWVVAAGNYIYHDKGLQGAWRPLHPKQYTNVHFTQYRTNLAWTDNNGAGISSVWLWDGKSAPELQDDAPPVRFLIEHQQRLCGWGDIANPRRFYLAADRKPNTWFSPSPTNIEDQFDTVLDAGYVEIPSRGIEVRAAWGDFFGMAVIVAEKGYWKLMGYGPTSYRLDGLKVGTGAANAQAITQVGNDLWIIGSQGITSLVATDQFGDIKAQYPSVPIQNLWSPNESSDEAINQTFIGTVRIIYSASRATVYIAVPHVSDQRAAQIYEYNTNTQKFYGPHEIDASAIVVGELASPITEVVMVGGASGQVAYFNPFIKLDYRSTSYTLEIETSALNGRSVDPTFIGSVKTWRKLRLYILPRGHWDFTITWWTDSDPNTRTDTVNQNTIKAYTIDRDLRLDLDPDSHLHSGGEISIKEIDLNVRGRNCTINIQSDYDWLVQGLEVEGLIDGYESDEDQD